MIAIILNDNVLVLLQDDAVISSEECSDGKVSLSGLNSAATVRHSCKLKDTSPADGPWTVDDLEDDPGFSLSILKESKQGQLMDIINRFIEVKPDGKVRYDTNLKLNMMMASLDALAAGQNKPAVVVSVEGWISAVRGEYFMLKATIAAAESAEALAEVDISYATLEAKYGVAGTVLPDPDVSTEQLLG